MSPGALVGYDWPQVLRALGIPVNHFKTRSTGVMIGLCFFHKEKTPSLVLWPKSRRWRCFGCGADYNVADNDMLHFALLYTKGYCAPSMREEAVALIMGKYFNSVKIENPDQFELQLTEDQLSVVYYERYQWWANARDSEKE